MFSNLRTRGSFEIWLRRRNTLRFSGAFLRVMTFNAKNKQKIQALGRLKQGLMNQTEAEYAEYLEAKKVVGQILWFKFEGLKLRLADGCFYTPDFFVMNADSEMECHEVKGFWTDDARVKIKVAASIYPFRFIALKKKSKRDGGGWLVEEF